MNILGDKYFDYRNFTKINPLLQKQIRTRDASQTVKMVVFHCDDAPHWPPERLSEFFVGEKGFPCCGYHYYVMKDKIYHMVNENLITYHAAPFNSKSVAFSIDFFPTRDEPLHIAVDSDVYENAIKIATYLCIKFKALPNYDGLRGHRELPGTGWFKDKQDHVHLRKICPGLSINLDIFRFEVTKRIQKTWNLQCDLPGIGGTKISEDGIIGPTTTSIIRTGGVSLV